MNTFKFFGHHEAFVARDLSGKEKWTLAEAGLYRLDDGEGSVLTVIGTPTGWGGWQLAIEEFGAPVWGVELDRFKGEFRLTVRGPDSTELIGPLPTTEIRKEVRHG